MMRLSLALVKSNSRFSLLSRVSPQAFRSVGYLQNKNPLLRKKSSKHSDLLIGKNVISKENKDVRNPNSYLRKTKQDYPEHWSEEKIKDGLETGKLLRGELRVSFNDLNTAYVSVSGGRVVLPSVSFRNRAIVTDSVAIQLVSREYTDKNGKNIKRIGEVVGILEEGQARLSTGKLIVRNKGTYFKSNDVRLPVAFIHSEDKYAKDHRETYFRAKIRHHSNTEYFPYGELQALVGKVGDFEAEKRRILIELEISDSPFLDKVMNCLPSIPKNSNWRIPEDEIRHRRDLRRECIFTIDPSTAKDLDDALHCKYLGDGIYEVGVHIADVSYFVKENTALDDEAKLRATSVYLVDKMIPMLPHLLCEQLCSLSADQDRLTFSVIWRMRENGEILDEWFGRTMIRSATKLSYAHAQRFIVDPNGNFSTDDFPRISSGHELSDIKEGVLNLHKIAQNLRTSRINSGASKIFDEISYAFELDPECGLPIGMSIQTPKDSNNLIEEYMVLANLRVAERIYRAWPKKAILRKHPEPDINNMKKVPTAMKKMGIELDISTVKSLANSIEQYCNGAGEAGKSISSWIKYRFSQQIKMAEYCCAGQVYNGKLSHYGLNLPLYTHFTSPIRRYPDILVHRQLSAALETSGSVDHSSSSLQTLCQHCSLKQRNAKFASLKSSDTCLSFFLYASERKERDVTALVTEISDAGFAVFLPQFRVDKFIGFKDLPAVAATHGKDSVTLRWENEQETHINLLSLVDCVIVSYPSIKPKWTVTLETPKKSGDGEGAVIIEENLSEDECRVE